MVALERWFEHNQESLEEGENYANKYRQGAGPSGRAYRNLLAPWHQEPVQTEECNRRRRGRQSHI